MTIKKVTEYTGNVADPYGSQSQAEFTQNAFDQFGYLKEFSPDLNSTIDEMNTAITNVENSETNAAASAAAAEAAAAGGGYEGLWPDTGGSALKGDVWQTQVGGTPTGDYFIALQDNAVAPSNDNTNWRSVNDHASLNNRNQPSAHDAASISRGASNVDDDISALEQFNDDIEYKALLSPCKNIVFDMQRDALKNQGAVSGEPLTTAEWTIASSVAVGDTTINIGTNTLVAGQLIGYLADNGEYYSSRVKQSGSTITLHDPIEANASAGNEVFTFYKDKSHPSVKGYRTIADYMLRQKIYQDISNDISALTYSKLTGSEVISTLSDDDFLNCGSSEYPSTRVQTSAQNSGFYTSNVRLACGDASIELVINTNGSDVRFRVSEVDDIAQFIVDRTINTELPTKIVIPIRKKLDSQLTIRVEQPNAGSADFNFIMKFLSGYSVKIESLNGGTHVLHGDSWFFQEGIYERLQERLPNANIINNGVGGRTSTNLAQTIYSEVKDLNPDYVWCMAGTNDAILGVSTSGYHRWMNQAIADIKNIGATPIIFTPSAGNLIDNWLSRSRAYLYSYDFRDGEGTQYEDVLLSFSGVKVPANSDVFCGSAGRTQDSVRVIEAFGSGVNNVNFGYSTGMAAPNIDAQSRAGNSIINTVNVTKSDSNARFFTISCENTTASEQEANGFARVRIKNSVK